jgi:hypothetical protein
MTGPFKRRFWEGVFVTGLGAGILALIPSQVKAISGLETNMSPAFIPGISGFSMVGIGAVLVFSAFFGKETGKPGGGTGTFVAAGELLRVLFSVLLLLAYTALFPVVGFMTTSGIFIGIFAYLLGQRNPAKLAAVILVMPTLVWVLFEIIFVIPLPHGFLF